MYVSSLYLLVEPHVEYPDGTFQMSLSFTGLERLEGGQQGIEGFFAGGGGATSTARINTPKMSTSNDSPKRHRSPSPAPMPLPLVKPSVGTASPPLSPAIITNKKPRLPTLHTGPARKTALESFLATNSSSSGSSSSRRAESPRASASASAYEARAQAQVQDPIEIVDVSDHEELDQESKLIRTGDADASGVEDNAGGRWVCPKCGFRPDDDGVDVERRAEVRQEHEDFHFAQDLQEAGSSPVRTMSRPSASAGAGGGVKVKKNKETKKQGIKAFFAPKAVKKE